MSGGLKIFPHLTVLPSKGRAYFPPVESFPQECYSLTQTEHLAVHSWVSVRHLYWWNGLGDLLLRHKMSLGPCGGEESAVGRYSVDLTVNPSGDITRKVWDSGGRSFHQQKIILCPLRNSSWCVSGPWQGWNTYLVPGHHKTGQVFSLVA